MKMAGFALVTSMMLAVPMFSAVAQETVPLDQDLAWMAVERNSRSTDINARAEAIRAMRFAAGRPTAQVLQDSLADSQWSVRRHAIIGLVLAGDPKAQGLVAESLRNQSIPLEAEALELVGYLPPASADQVFKAALLEAANPARDLLMNNVLSGCPDVMAKWFAEGLVADPAWFIDKFEKVPKDVLPALLDKLAGDKRPEVFEPAVKVAAMKGLKIDMAVLNAVMKSKDATLRVMAAEAAARQGNQDAIAILLPLADGSEADRIRFLKAAAAAPSPVAQQKAWGMMKPDINPEMVNLIYMCFPATDTRDVLKALDADVESTDAARRPGAVKAVGRVKGNRALPQLYDLMSNAGNPNVRTAAAQAIGDLAQVESIPALHKALNDREIAVKMAVIEAMGKIRDREVIGRVSSLAFDPNQQVRLAALKVIADVNHKDAVAILRTAADDPNPAVRAMVLGAMMKLDSNASLNRFERALVNLGERTFLEYAADMKDDFAPFAKAASTSQYQWARDAVLKAMKYMPAVRINLLQEMALASNYEDTRIAALGVLASFDADIAFKIADAMMKDQSPRIRAAAFRVIGQSAAPEVPQMLLAGIEDPDEYVKTVAAGAILERAAATKKGPRGSKAQPAPKKAQGRK